MKVQLQELGESKDSSEKVTDEPVQINVSAENSERGGPVTTKVNVFETAGEPMTPERLETIWQVTTSPLSKELVINVDDVCPETIAPFTYQM